MTQLRIVSWNVLADDYLNPDWFPHLPAADTRRGARISRVLDIITATHADVIALQEADAALAEAARRTMPDYTVIWDGKGNGKPDGCLTLVRKTISISGKRRFMYQDTPFDSGHVAQFINISACDDRPLLLVNTHLKWAQSAAAAHQHPGIMQVQELVKRVAGQRTIVCADLNDTPGGPVRAILAAAGFDGCADTRPTSLFNDSEHRPLDVVATHGLPEVTREVPTITSPIPSADFPSDHVPVTAVVSLHCGG